MSSEVLRVAAIDCGTNSIRLLISDVTVAAGSVVTATDVLRRMEVVRLGEGVDKTGRLAPEALERTLAMVSEYAAACEAHEVAAVRFVATSASRDAENRDEFVVGVRERLGVLPEVIAGSEEAQLSFTGAVRSLGAAVPSPHVVIDIGGGSTEFVLGTSHVAESRSIDIGCVRLAERHVLPFSPSLDDYAAMVSDIDAAIDGALEAVNVAEARSLVGLAGSVTTITACALGLKQYDSEAIHGAELSASQVIAACEFLMVMNRDERAALGFMHPGRVDVIGAGAAVWRQVVRRVLALSGDIPIITSERDILDGIALSVAERHISQQ